MRAMNPRIFAAIALLSPPAAAWALAEDGPARPQAPDAADPAAASATAADSETDDPLAPWDEQKPPPGSAEDVALWRAGIEVSRSINLERLRANKMQWEHRQRKYDERLAALAREEGRPEGKKAAELLPRYNQAVAFNYVTMTRQWPVDPTRGCRYPVLHFEGVLRSGEHRKKATQLVVTREELQDCLDKARPALKVMADSNEALAGLVAEAEAILPALPVARPSPPAKPGGADQGPAAAAQN
jgi:hypothetical protein